jgi:hypothetical protein
MDLTRGSPGCSNPRSAGDSPEEYCRAIEAYLCRKNDGHLIRIVGPSFERVCAWARRGVPIKVAFRGIDRYFERYYAKGPRRRPVRVDFCEADVLDVFDEWRRAVGIALSDHDSAFAATTAREVPSTEVTTGMAGLNEGTAAEDGGSEGASRRGQSLPSHLERVVARLTALRSGSDRTLDPFIDDIIRELDNARATAKQLRGARRAALVSRLAQIDADLVAAARERLTAETHTELRREAETELAPFRARMPQPAYEQSLAACVNRLLRERARLPVVAFE